MTTAEIKQMLGLKPHPVEGGFYRRTYTSPGSVELPRGRRSQGTAIYYLLEPGTFSEMHMLASDEIFHFYLGDPVEMLQLRQDGSSAVFTLGPDRLVGSMFSSSFRQECGKARGSSATAKWHCSAAPSRPDSTLPTIAVADTTNSQYSGPRRQNGSKS